MKGGIPKGEFSEGMGGRRSVSVCTCVCVAAGQAQGTSRCCHSFSFVVPILVLERSRRGLGGSKLAAHQAHRLDLFLLSPLLLQTALP